MIVTLTYGLLAGLFITQGSAATCSSNLLIDNFAKASAKTNSLGTLASDDGTLKLLNTTGTSITFVPAAMSYFYETLPCVQAKSQNYTAVSFTMQAPAGASFMLEIQTRPACGAANYASYWYTVGGFTGGQEPTVVTVPLSAFEGQGANIDAITAFNWATWSKVCKRSFGWSLGDVQFVCGAAE